MCARLFFPKRFKYRILQKKRKIKLPQYGNVSLIYGSVSCKPTQIGVLTAKHMRRLILFFKKIFKKRKTKVNACLWIPYFPHTPIFKKHANSRMGKGKGKRVGWYTNIYPGLSFFETKGIRCARAKFFGNIVVSRLPFLVKYISNQLISNYPITSLRR